MSAEHYPVCLYGAEAESVATLAESLKDLWPLKIAACCHEQDQLIEHLHTNRTAAVLVILGAERTESLDLVALLARDHREVTLIGLSDQRDPQLVADMVLAGCSQFVPLPADRQTLISAFENIGVGLVPAGESGRRICVVGASGGVGATTVACNLAVEMARICERGVAIADLHMGFGDVGVQFGVGSKHSIDKLCRPSQQAAEDRIRQVATSLPCRVSVLPAPQSLSQPPRLGGKAVSHLLWTLSRLHDAVIVDAPRMPTPASWAAVDQAQAILMVMQLTASCVRKARSLYDHLLERSIPKGRIHLVINRYQEEFAAMTLEDVASSFAQEIFATIPSDYELVRASTDASHPLLFDAPVSPVRLAICSMAHHLMGLDAPEQLPKPTPKSHQSGLLGRLLKV